jgi:hypothetical protein
MNVTFELIKRQHGAKAPEVWKRICELGMFGNVPQEYAGGLDVGGLRHDFGGAVSEDAVKRIEDLVAGDKLRN